MSEPVIRVLTGPSIFGLAMEYVPLVRRGIITDAEGRWLVSYYHRLGWIEAEQTARPA